MSCLIYLPKNLDAHKVSSDFLEVSARALAVSKVLNDDHFSDLEKIVLADEHQVSQDQICLVHTTEYFDLLNQPVKQNTSVMLDRDTHLGSDSFTTAKLASWAACDAVLKVAEKGGNAFCGFRPPGHHATPNKAMGFCFTNHVAIAAMNARKILGVKKLAILDPDVHHGNGTQDAAWNDKDFFYASSHQSPHYPGSGSASETGNFNNIFNAPMVAGTSAQDFLQVWQHSLLPAMVEFQPEIVLVSAGFDAHEADPLGELCLNDADFYTWADMVMEATAKTPARGVVSVLEGGYNLTSLGQSVFAYVSAMAEKNYSLYQNEN